MRHRWADEFEQSVNQNGWFAAIPMIVISAVGMIMQFTASQQAAQNAQAVANYNAMLQQRNAQVAYQMQVYQAQQAAAIAANNQAMVRTRSPRRLRIRDVQLQNAKILRDQVETIRMQQREEASRMRQDSDRRVG